MFRSLPGAQFGSDEAENLTNLGALGTAMAATFDPPHDGNDEEESGIPALYTYLAQFIDHDITFDPALLNLYPDWQPPSGPDYALKDFVTYALGR